MIKIHYQVEQFFLFHVLALVFKYAQLLKLFFYFVLLVIIVLLHVIIFLKLHVELLFYFISFLIFLFHLHVFGVKRQKIKPYFLFVHDLLFDESDILIQTHDLSRSQGKYFFYQTLISFKIPIQYLKFVFLFVLQGEDFFYVLSND